MARNADARVAPDPTALLPPRPRTRPGLGRTDLVSYLASGLFTVVAMVPIMRLWRANLHVPFYYLANDATAVAAHAKTVLETGWYEYQPDLGAPVGQHYHDFPTADNLHMMAFNVLGWFTGDFAVVLNLYYLIGFPLAALTATYFLRQVGVSRLLAAPLAVLYALAPYHFYRNEGHLFLGAYYPVPLALVVVLRIIRGQPVWGVRTIGAGRLLRLPPGWRAPAARILGVVTGRGAGTVLILGVLATASTYYAVFAVMLIAAAGLLHLVRTGNRHRFFGAVAAGVTTVVVVGINMFPDSLYQWVNGANPVALSRDGAASEIFALKISALLLPAPTHPIPLLAAFRLNYDSSYPVPSESPALGLVGAIGLLVLLVTAVELVANRVRNRAKPDARLARREVLRQLAALTLVALLCATVGGVGTLISFVSPNIRGWNRISIMISMFCLAAVGILLDGWIRRRRDRVPRGRPVFGVAVAGLVLVVGLGDQSLSSAVPPYTASAVAYSTDHAFVKAIEAQVPAGSMIFQLPFVEFPESPPVNKVGDADQLRMYLNSTTLRWSAAAIKGRPQSDWPAAVSSRRPQVMVRSLATIGFAGIVLDRKRLGSEGTDVEKSLLPYLGAPVLTSGDQRYAYFSLAGTLAQIQQSTPADQLAARAAELINPVMTYPGLEFNAVDRAADGVSYRLWKSRRNNGAVTVDNDRDAPVTVHLQVQLASDKGAPDVQLTVGDSTFVVKLPGTTRPPIDASGNAVDPTFVAIDQVVTVPAGTSRLTLSPGPETLASADAADVQYSFQHLFLLDNALVG